MLILASHVLGFLSLLIGAIYDLKTTEVPDLVSLIGIVGGVSLHAVHAYTISSLEPLMWSLGVGTLFFVYGWAMYYYGMWGGADALAMAVLGFAAPYGLSSQGLIHPVNLFINLMLIGFVYTISFAVYQAIRSGGVLSKTVNNIINDERRISLEIVMASGASAFSEIYLNVNGLAYFVVFLSLIFLYRFLSVLEESSMIEKVPVSEIRPGDVIEQEDVDIETVRQRNLVGSVLERLKARINSDSLNRFLSSLQARYGYSQIVGITEEELERLENSDVEEVGVKTGVRFIPAFPIALAMTDLLGGGIQFLTFLIGS